MNVNLVRLFIIAALFVLVGVVVPHVLMHYEVGNGVVFVMSVLALMLGLFLWDTLRERRAIVQAAQREKDRTSWSMGDR